MEKEFFRIICVDEDDPLEYRVLVDTNKGSLEEVHKYMDDNFYKHRGKGVKWMLLPATINM